MLSFLPQRISFLFKRLNFSLIWSLEYSQRLNATTNDFYKTNPRPMDNVIFYGKTRNTHSPELYCQNKTGMVELFVWTEQRSVLQNSQKIHGKHFLTLFTPKKGGGERKFWLSFSAFVPSTIEFLNLTNVSKNEPEKHNRQTNVYLVNPEKASWKSQNLWIAVLVSWRWKTLWTSLLTFKQI